MKKTTLTFASVLLIIATTFAQSLTELTPKDLNGINLSGKYVGKRHQFNYDKTTIMQSFEYEFELKQEGDIISGFSTIIKQNGDYADMKLRGVIVGDKLYFEEYEIANQAKDINYTWCYKSGALSLRKDGDRLKLVGKTDSYMADYYLPCTGGVTDLTKVDNSSTFTPSTGSVAYDAVDGSNILSVFPNPFVDNAKISYKLTSDAKVTTEVFDITGKRVAVLESNTAKNAGSYTIDFNSKNYGYSAGVLIAKLTVDGKIYSSQMVQMR